MRVGLVSDIHCQHQALEEAVRRMGPVERIICAGDCINQSRFCNRTISLLRDLDAEVILGNHDLEFLSSTGDADRSSDETLRQWLAERPRELRLDIAGLNLHVVHATSWSPDFPYVAPAHPHFGRFGADDADVVVYGHTHVPVIRSLGGTLVVNPGSVGEGRPCSKGFVRSCAVLDTVSRHAEIIDLD